MTTLELPDGVEEAARLTAGLDRVFMHGFSRFDPRDPGLVELAAAHPQPLELGAAAEGRQLDEEQRREHGAAQQAHQSAALGPQALRFTKRCESVRG